MVATHKFQTWLRLEILRRNGQMVQIDAYVERELRNVKIEFKQAGLWVEQPTRI